MRDFFLRFNALCTISFYSLKSDYFLKVTYLQIHSFIRYINKKLLYEKRQLFKCIAIDIPLHDYVFEFRNLLLNSKVIPRKIKNNIIFPTKYPKPY